jgi:hypothetical protein
MKPMPHNKKHEWKETHPTWKKIIQEKINRARRDIANLAEHFQKRKTRA